VQTLKRSRLPCGRFASAGRGANAVIDSWFSDRVLMSALMASAGMHALVLAVRFVDPELLRYVNPTRRWKSCGQREERGESVKPQALAQANLEGGAATKRAGAARPFRTWPRSATRDDRGPAQDGRQLEQEQRQLLAMVRRDFVLLRGGGAQGNERRRTRTRAGPSAAGSDGSGKFPERFRITSSGRAGIISCRAPRGIARALLRRLARTGRKVGNQNYPEERRGIYGHLQMTVVKSIANGTLLDAIIERRPVRRCWTRGAPKLLSLASPIAVSAEIAHDTDLLEITRTWMFTNDQFGTRAVGDATSASH